MLVNNAGIGDKMAIEDEPLDRFRLAMEVNVTAAVASLEARRRRR